MNKGIFINFVVTIHCMFFFPFFSVSYMVLQVFSDFHFLTVFFWGHR